MTKSEEVVYGLCKKAFLSLWTIANPVGKETGKELCDAIVVFDKQVLIISVKEIQYKATKDIITGWERWKKAAIEKSIKQLRGAKRYIESVDEIRSKDNQFVLKMSGNNDRKYHLITISLGSKRQLPIGVPLKNGEVIHFFDEYSLEIVFNELDTINDFIEYLGKKEKITLESKKIIVGSEEDLLAYYVWNNRSFPKDYDVMIFEDDMWEGVKLKKEYLGKKKEDKISYFWDSIIEEFINMRDPEVFSLLGYFDQSNENVEFALRIMAKENRFSRRVLSQAFWDFQLNKEIASRVVNSINDVVYIFLKKPIEISRVERQSELFARCMIIRNRINRNVEILGIATENDISRGHSFDLIYYQKEEWTTEDKKIAESAVKDLGLFVNPRHIIIHADEFPEK